MSRSTVPLAGLLERAPATLLLGALMLLLSLPPAGAAPTGGSATPATDAGPAVQDGSASVPRPAVTPAAPAPDVYADTDESALTYFRPTLDPYGTWINDSVYGTVWVPYPRYAGYDFAPYVSSGRWALADNGDWVWVSDFSWGWVVFHYGRWVWISGTGWAWIPGRRYASAWVVWRVPEPGYYYVGWAPMPPTFIWVGGVGVVFHRHPPLPFVFCHSRYVFVRSLRRHLVPRQRLRFVAAHTRRYHRPARSPLMGPPAARAHVPASAMPKARVHPSPAAVLAARRSTSARVRQPGRVPARPAPVRPGHRVPAAPRAAPRPRAAPHSMPRAAPPPRTAPRPRAAPAPRRGTSRSRAAPPPSARPPSRPAKPKGRSGRPARPPEAAPPAKGRGRPR